MHDSVHGNLAHTFSYTALVDPHSVSASPSHLSPDRRGRGKAPSFCPPTLVQQRSLPFPPEGGKVALRSSDGLGEPPGNQAPGRSVTPVTEDVHSVASRGGRWRGEAATERGLRKAKTLEVQAPGVGRAAISPSPPALPLSNRFAATSPRFAGARNRALPNNFPTPVGISTFHPSLGHQPTNPGGTLWKRNRPGRPPPFSSPA